MSRTGGVVNRKGLRRASILQARVEDKVGETQRGWLKIRQGAISLFHKRWVVVSGHYVQVFALSTPGSAPLSALDLRMFAVVEPRNASSEDFELRDSIGTTFGFQARDAAEARTWVEVIERLRAKDKVQEEKEPASPEDNGQKAGSTQANKALFIEKMMAQKSSRLAARNELESIDGIARHRAAAAVADSFQDSNDLRGLETFEEEIKAKLASVSIAVDASFAKQDSRAQLILRRVGESGTGVTSIRGSMAGLQSAVHESSFWSRDKGVASARGLVRDAQSAKNNLSKTLNLCHQWLGVPSRVKQLRAALDSEPLMLLAVFTELRDLEAWRKSLLHLLKRLDKDTSSNHNNSASASSSDSTNVLNSVTSGLDAHMDSVLELAAAVREKLWQNVKRFFELGTANPAVLVMTFQVIEERERAKEAMRKAASKPNTVEAGKSMRGSAGSWGVRGDRAPHSPSESMDNADELDEDDPEEEQDYRAKGMGLLHETIAERAEGAFKQFHKPPSTSGASGGQDNAKASNENRVGLALSAASHVLSELTIMVKEVAPCVPKEYSVVVLARNLYQSFLLVPLEAIYSHPSSLSTVELLKVIEWLDYYDSEMGSLMQDDNQQGSGRGHGANGGGRGSFSAKGGSCEEFTAAADRLMTDYMGRMREQLSGWVETVRILEQELVKDKDGKFATAYPNDLMRLMRLQLDTAGRLLKPHRFVWILGPAAMALRTSQMAFDDLLHVASASLLLKELAAKRGDDFDDQDDSLPVERLVGLGNDLVRMSSLVSGYRDEIFAAETERMLALHESGVSLDESLTGFNEASREYLQLSFKTVTILSRTMLLDLLPTIANGVCTVEWEDEATGAVAVETLVATLTDYFGEFEDLCDDYLWPRCTKACVGGLLSAYLERFAATQEIGGPMGAASSSLAGGLNAKAATSKAVSIFSKIGKKQDGDAESAENKTDMFKGSGGVPDMMSGGAGNDKGGAGLVAPFGSRTAVARRLESDMTCLLRFFESVEDLDLNRMDISVFLSPLRLLADIIKAPSAAAAEDSTTELTRILLQCDLAAFPPARQEVFKESVTRLLTTVWRRRGVRPEPGGPEEGSEEFDAIVAGLF